jgi:hypothetical protein
MTIVLLVTCIITPYHIVFSRSNELVNNLTDVLFAVDILVIFNTAYYNLNMDLVDDRKAIAKHYLKGWFTVDLLPIIPFEIMLTKIRYQVNGLVRIARIGRIYRLVKLIRMLRFLKIMKDKSKLMKYLNSILKISHSLERLLFSMILFFILCHIVSCFWLLIASIDSDKFTGSWAEEFKSDG